MADPNTQIDWWISQAWQEAQGGADNDALVTWLHENGLTAISSYTILQAALSCPPGEAKEIVFGHPAWAGEEPDTDVDNLDYTSDTLEPEPEPDAAFELDDWAENIEEDEPVYGEEGDQPDSGAGAAPPEYNPDSPGPADTGGAITLEPALSGTAEPAQAFEETGGFDDAAGFEDETNGPDLAPANPVSASEPEPASAPDEPAAPVATMPPADEIAPPEPAPVPPAPAPAAKTPPASPSARAAVFAGAFGKKPAAAPATGGPAAMAELSASETADVALAQVEPEPPQPAMAADPMPPPLVYEPLPDIEIPQPMAPVEPLFSSPQRDPQPAPLLFPPAATDQPPAEADVPAPEQPADPGVTASNGETMPEQTGEPAPLAAEPEEPSALDAEPEPAVTPSDLDPAAEPDLAIVEEEPVTAPAPAMDDAGDLPPGMQSAIGQDEAEPQGEMTESQVEEAGEPAPTDWEQELPSLDEEEEADEAGYPSEEQDSDEMEYPSEEPVPDISPPMADEGEYEDEADDAMPRPQKRLLLDPSGEADEDGLPGSDPRLDDIPPNMAEAARRLGVNFRESDLSDAGVDPELAKVAKELGISFREGSDADEPEDDETAIEAQKLGINFREGDSMSDQPPKPLVAKYLPLFLGVVIIFFLLLLGATFAGEFIGWLWN